MDSSRQARFGLLLRRTVVLGAGLQLLLALGFSIPSTSAAQSDSGVRRLMLQAESLAAEGRLLEAIEEYERVAEAVPDHSLAADALVEAAALYRRDGQNLRAAEVAGTVVEGYPATDAAARALVLRADVLAEEATDRTMLESVVADLEALLLRFDRDRYPALEARGEALVLVGELRLHLGAAEEAAAPLVEVLEDETISVHTAKAELLLARSLLERGEVAAAWQPLQRAAAPNDTYEAKQAKSLLTLLHRLVLRPQRQEPSWSSTRSLTGPADGFKKPRYVAASTLGRVAVIDSGVGGLLYDDVESGPASTITTLRDATRPSFDDEAVVFVAPEAIEREGVRDVFTTGGAKPKTLERMEATARDGYGSWLILDRSLDGVALFDRGRSWQKELSLGGEPVDIVNRDGGEIHVLTSRPGQVQIYSNDLEARASISLPTDRPTALDVDALGNLYVLDEQRKTVHVLDREGTTIATLGPVLPGGTELRSPNDLAVDGGGTIYLTDSRLDVVLAID